MNLLCALSEEHGNDINNGSWEKMQQKNEQLVHKPACVQGETDVPHSLYRGSPESVAIAEGHKVLPGDGFFYGGHIVVYWRLDRADFTSRYVVIRILIESVNIDRLEIKLK